MTDVKGLKGEGKPSYIIEVRATMRPLSFWSAVWLFKIFSGQVLHCCQDAQGGIPFLYSSFLFYDQRHYFYSFCYDQESLHVREGEIV